MHLYLWLFIAAKSEEFPKKPLGLELSLNVVSVVSANGQKKMVNDLNHDKDAVTRSSPDHKRPSLNETLSNSHTALPQSSGPPSPADMHSSSLQNHQPSQQFEGEENLQAEEKLVQLSKETGDNVSSEDFPAMLAEVQLNGESEDVPTANKEADSVDTSSTEWSSLKENLSALSVDDRAPVVPQMLPQAPTESVVRDGSLQESNWQGPTEAELSMSPHYTAPTLLDQESSNPVPLLPSLEGQGCFESVLSVQHAAALPGGSTSKDFLSEDVTLLPDHLCQPFCMDSCARRHSRSTVSDWPENVRASCLVKALLALPSPLEDGKRRPSNVSQYDNLSEDEDGKEGSNYEKLAGTTSQTELCALALKCTVPKSASVGEMDNLQRYSGETGAWMQQPKRFGQPSSFNFLPLQKRLSGGGSVPILSELDSDPLLLLEGVHAQHASSPALQEEQYSPFRIVKTTTPLHLVHATEQGSSNKKQVALPLPEIGHNDDAQGKKLLPPVVEAEVGAAKDCIQKVTVLRGASAPQTLRPKGPLKIVKTHSDSNFYPSCSPIVQIPKSVTF